MHYMPFTLAMLGQVDRCYTNDSLVGTSETIHFVTFLTHASVGVSEFETPPWKMKSGWVTRRIPVSANKIATPSSTLMQRRCTSNVINGTKICALPISNEIQSPAQKNNGQFLYENLSTITHVTELDSNIQCSGKHCPVQCDAVKW